MEQQMLRPLSRLDIQFESATAQSLSNASLALASLRDRHGDFLRKRAFADACLHIESFANIKMTGRQTNIRDQLHMPFFLAKADPTQEQKRQESLRSIDALLKACELGQKPIVAHTFLDIHRELCTNTTRDLYKGMLRTTAKQVGGSRYHEFGALSTLPDPHAVPDLLSDLARFCNKTSLPAIAQAALAYVQFIALHPFNRANGKTARAVIQLIFQHRNLIADAIAPLSLPMVTSPHEYQNGVIETAKNLLSEQPDIAQLNTWMRFFCDCCISAVEEVRMFERQVESMQDEWLHQLNARSDSATTLLVKALPGIPVLSASSAAEYLDRSFKRTSTAIDELVKANIVVQITKGKRNRVFECPAIIDAYAHIAGFQ